MLTVALALGASLTWGVADFFGPLKARTFGALRVLVYAQLGGLVVIALAVVIRGKGPEGAATLLAVPAAISGTLGLYAYYRGVAVGAISVVAPIAGVSAAVPVIVGIASGAGAGSAGRACRPFAGSRGRADPRGRRPDLPRVTANDTSPAHGLQGRDPGFDHRAQLAYLLEAHADGIGEIPVRVLLAGQDRARVPAPHRHDDLCPLDLLAGDRLRPTIRKVDPDLVHRLDDGLRR
jgi:uncharacterized membrane protein